MLSFLIGKTNGEISTFEGHPFHMNHATETEAQKWMDPLTDVNETTLSDLDMTGFTIYCCKSGEY